MEVEVEPEDESLQIMEAEAEAEGEGEGDVERRVLAALKASESRGDPPLLQALHLASQAPTAALASVLVSHLSSHPSRLSSPALWNLLHHSMASRLLFPPHALALLTPALLPLRRAHPQAFRLFLELLHRHLPLFFPPPAPCRHQIAKSMADALQQLSVDSSSSSFGKRLSFGSALLLFLLHALTALIDSSLEDWGLPFTSHDLALPPLADSMDLDMKDTSSKKEQLRRSNAFTALEVVRSLTSNKRILRLLRLAHLNM